MMTRTQQIKEMHAEYRAQAMQFKAEGNIRGAIYMLGEAAIIRGYLAR